LPLRLQCLGGQWLWSLNAATKVHWLYAGIWNKGQEVVEVLGNQLQIDCLAAHVVDLHGDGIDGVQRLQGVQNEVDHEEIEGV